MHALSHQLNNSILSSISEKIRIFYAIAPKRTPTASPKPRDPPKKVAGCYAPGGRYPLPSSVLMTVVTARAAGCPYVVLCSPKPAPITLAAAHVSGADLVLSVGGAQAIGAMAYGVSSAGECPEVPPCDVIVGPGNRWVTAAKSIVSGRCGIGEYIMRVMNRSLLVLAWIFVFPLGPSDFQQPGPDFQPGPSNFRGHNLFLFFLFPWESSS